MDRPGTVDPVPQTAAPSNQPKDPPMRLSPVTEQRLRDELRELNEVKLPALRDAVVDTRTQGDIGQNPDYFTIAAEEGMVIARIEQIRHALRQHETAGDAPAGDGTVLPGRTVTIDFGDGPERFHFGSIEEQTGLEVITPASPIGAAIAGRRAGDTVTLASGLAVTVVAVDD